MGELQLPLVPIYIMLVSHSHKFVLFHYPKTGGSSMTYALAPILSMKETATGPWQATHHFDLIQHRPVKECNIPYGYFTAAFVRNPFEIVFSAWDEEQSFEEFVMEVVPDKTNIATRWTQYEYLTNSGEKLIDFIGRVENMDMDWKKFCWINSLHNLELCKLNVSEERDYKDFYNEKTIVQVTKLFQDDLNYFGYKY